MVRTSRLAARVLASAYMKQLGKSLLIVIINRTWLSAVLCEFCLLNIYLRQRIS